MRVEMVKVTGCDCVQMAGKMQMFEESLVM